MGGKEISKSYCQRSTAKSGIWSSGKLSTCQRKAFLALPSLAWTWGLVNSAGTLTGTAYFDRMRVRLRYETEDGYLQKHLMLTVKYGGGSITLWTCLASKGLGNIIRMHDFMKSYQ
ncbi:hypothetical protein ATANTOWER_011671 [Ataeniobius toweri]|uniref:Uncharacterized protein n=1 Tax=Ataeniobius toweri TaxID=208326 RepID=A0ABU7CI35_9TELE|nr:hypothetical protein [Ataeniobius toweri]